MDEFYLHHPFGDNHLSQDTYSLGVGEHAYESSLPHCSVVHPGHPPPGVGVGVGGGHFWFLEGSHFMGDMKILFLYLDMGDNFVLV